MPRRADAAAAATDSAAGESWGQKLIKGLFGHNHSFILCSAVSERGGADRRNLCDPITLATVASLICCTLFTGGRSFIVCDIGKMQQSTSSAQQVEAAAVAAAAAAAAAAADFRGRLLQPHPPPPPLHPPFMPPFHPPHPPPPHHPHLGHHHDLFGGGQQQQQPQGDLSGGGGGGGDHQPRGLEALRLKSEAAVAAALKAAAPFVNSNNSQDFDGKGNNLLHKLSPIESFNLLGNPCFFPFSY